MSGVLPPLVVAVGKGARENLGRSQLWRPREAPRAQRRHFRVEPTGIEPVTSCLQVESCRELARPTLSLLSGAFLVVQRSWVAGTAV